MRLMCISAQVETLFGASLGFEVFASSHEVVVLFSDNANYVILNVIHNFCINV